MDGVCYGWVTSAPRLPAEHARTECALTFRLQRKHNNAAPDVAGALWVSKARRHSSRNNASAQVLKNNASTAAPLVVSYNAVPAVQRWAHNTTKPRRGVHCVGESRAPRTNNANPSPLLVPSRPSRELPAHEAGARSSSPAQLPHAGKHTRASDRRTCRPNVSSWTRLGRVTRCRWACGPAVPQMRSNEQLEDALDRALAAAGDVPHASSAAWREELPAARAYASADADALDAYEVTRSQAAFAQRERAARLASMLAGAQLADASGAAAAPAVRSGAVREQLDAALREVTAVLRRGHDSAHESAPVRLLAVRAAAAGAEHRAAATAARVLAARSETLHRRGRLAEEARPGAREPELSWQRDVGRAEASAPRQLALAPRAEPARRGSESRASQSRGGLAHAAGSRRLQALARDGVHNALLKRAARVAAAWDDDED